MRQARTREEDVEGDPMAELRDPSSEAPGEIEIRDAFLRVRFTGGGHGDFHWFWLRHNCDCCRHPTTGERTLCSSRVPLEIRPASAILTETSDGPAVVVSWETADRHRSTFDLGWLREHAYAPDRVDVAPPSNDTRAIEIRDAAPASTASVAAGCLALVAERGLAVVRGFGPDTDALIDAFIALGLQVVETHFGRIEDLRTDNTTNQNTDQLGYTDAPVDLHTDQPFLAEPPRYQILHCVRPADRGGDNAVADGRQAALYLRATDAPSFDLLSRVPVRFHRRQKAFERLQISPIVELAAGEVRRIRSSYFTMAPHRVPFEEMAAWYRAYNTFARLVADPRYHYRFRLESGDFLIYDNHRMLHARTSFEGPRWLRGVYFDLPASAAPPPPGGNVARAPRERNA